MYYSQIDQLFSSFGMSTSRLFLAKQEEKEIEETDSLSKPSSEINSDAKNIQLTVASSSSELQEHKEEENPPDDDQPTVAPRESEEKLLPRLGQTSSSYVAAADDDCDEEGFKTPTSLDQRIPTVLQCPPAPKKSRPETSTKRKVSPSAHRSLHLDLSHEVEPMFPPLTQDDDDIRPKVKRARKDHPE